MSSRDDVVDDTVSPTSFLAGGMETMSLDGDMGGQLPPATILVPRLLKKPCGEIVSQDR